MSQFDGLADRTRVFAQEPTAQHFPVISFDEAHVGGIVIRAVQGTRYANGRVEVAGKLDNSIEIQFRPGELCQSRGVVAQILMFAAQSTLGYLRHCFSWNRGADNDPLTDHFVEDQGASGERVCMPWSRNMGAKTYLVAGGLNPKTGQPYQVGEDDGGHDVEVLFRDGSDEYTLPDGRRITYRSAFEAVVQMAAANGIALEIR
jgi:hypothetical protein